MAILAECPRGHRKQAVKNRNCVACESDLVKPKRAGKVHYWIHYRLPSGKQRWEFVKLEDGRPAGIEEARAAEGKRTLTPDEYLRLVDVAAPHLKGIITTAFNTGMRAGEIRGLKWSQIDREHGVIRLTADMTKESRAKMIPINHHVIPSCHLTSKIKIRKICHRTKFFRVFGEIIQTSTEVVLYLIQIPACLVGKILLPQFLPNMFGRV